MTVVIDIAIDAPAWKSIAGAKQAIRNAIKEAIAGTGLTDIELGVVLTDDARIRKLNHSWRGFDQATNILSFPSSNGALTSPRFLGDLVLSFETITREAAVEKKPVLHHLAHLAVHGTLHLVGFGHERDQEAEVMENCERAILARLGIPDPYASETQRHKQLA